MTWILGSGVMFGYGALISDVRVSWGSGDTLDALQKIYPAAPNMMAGFAGSVELGFQLIADMQRAFVLPRRSVWPTRVAAWHWRRRARRRFADAPATLRALGSQVILVGVSPTKDGPFLRAHCVTMRAPEYWPVWAKPREWASIGSGSAHENAKYFANLMADAEWQYLQNEVVSPGEVARSVATTVVIDLMKTPMASVSGVLQIGRAKLDSCEYDPLMRYKQVGAWSIPERDDRKLIASWSELRKVARDMGLDASAAST
jgi:hypothetical protein